MEVFNEEGKNKGKIILLLKRKDAQILFEAMHSAVNANKRRKSWGNLYDQLEIDMSCY